MHDNNSKCLVVSIPIIVLRRTQLKRSQKLGLSAFLSLSASMIILALVRITGGQTLTGYSHVWEFRWLYMEACIACFMASISAFRSFFIPTSSRAWMKQPGRPSTQTRQQVWKKFKDPTRRRRSINSPDLDDALLVSPSAALIRLQNPNRSNDRPARSEPNAESEFNLLDGITWEGAGSSHGSNLENGYASNEESFHTSSNTLRRATSAF